MTNDTNNLLVTSSLNASFLFKTLEQIDDHFSSKSSDDHDYLAKFLLNKCLLFFWEFWEIYIFNNKVIMVAWLLLVYKLKGLLR